MFFLADTSQKVDEICFAYSCIYSVQFKFRQKFSYFAPSDNRERPFIADFHMASLIFKLQNYRSYRDFTFMMY